MLSKFSIFSSMIILVSVMSCSSWVESTRKSLLDDDSPRKVNKDVKWVSRQQYDDLMGKYKDLNTKYENLKSEKLKSGDVASTAEISTESIDVFGKDGLANQVEKKQQPVSVDDAVKEIDLYKKAVTLKSNGKATESLEIFQFLEKSSISQVSVRARKHIGEIYFGQKKYDVALQVFESIIRQNSFSSTVIDALSYASKCSAQLGLTDKQLKYESILKDFFEIRV